MIAACRSGPVRSAFLLSRLEGLGYQEIAERLGMSLSSVEQSLILAASSRQVEHSAMNAGAWTRGQPQRISHAPQP